MRRFVLPGGVSDELVVEEPLIIVAAGEPLVTMRSPGHDEELVRGFLVSERICASPADIISLRCAERDGVSTLEVELREGLKGARGRLTRVHEIRASCGLCGVPTVDRLADDLTPLRPGWPRFEVADLSAGLAGMSVGQEVFQASGGSHAAALIRGSELILMREDVGRHNAVDKVIGAALGASLPLKEMALLLSGRSGFELVLKALRVGIACVVSVSAPTSFAVELCEEAGATLCGFARAGGMKVYSDDGRLRMGGGAG